MFFINGESESKKHKLTAFASELYHV